MNTGPFASTLDTIFRELVHGSPDPGARTFVLNQGDAGLLASLDRLSAAAASTTHEDAPSIAAHVDHLRYGLSLLNRWASRKPLPKDMDWSSSWRRSVVSDLEWRSLRDELRREVETWTAVLGTPRDATDVEAGWLTGSVAHLAYHLGAIRQLDRTTRGPSAEDEARAQAGRRDS